jgi:flagellar basal body-associated protein FliL
MSTNNIDYRFPEMDKKPKEPETQEEKILGIPINERKALRDHLRALLEQHLILPLKSSTEISSYPKLLSDGLQQIIVSAVADSEISREKESSEVDFYMAFPQPEFTLLLSKIVVNLKSEGEANPMVAFQAFVITESEETSAEIKTREKEMLDLIGRTAEEFTYQELSTEPGKERLKREIRKTVNGALSQGRVLSAYFKIFISKP